MTEERAKAVAKALGGTERPACGGEAWLVAFDRRREGGAVAIVYDGDVNGAVLAAAPDLLAACESVAANLDGRPNLSPDEESLLDTLNAAIVKAKGK